tara:strand:- start:326 stop:586 length:261 start_codon:yes stop_codon:yes gene_type:complete
MEIDLIKLVAEETKRILKDNPNPFLGKTKKDAFQIGIEISLFDRFENTNEKNKYEELNELVHDLQGNLGDIVDGVFEWINKNYKEK